MLWTNRGFGNGQQLSICYVYLQYLYSTTYVTKHQTMLKVTKKKTLIVSDFRVRNETFHVVHWCWASFAGVPSYYCNFYFKVKILFTIKKPNEITSTYIYCTVLKFLACYCCSLLGTWVRSGIHTLYSTRFFIWYYTYYILVKSARWAPGSNMVGVYKRAVGIIVDVEMVAKAEKTIHPQVQQVAKSIRPIRRVGGKNE